MDLLYVIYVEQVVRNLDVQLLMTDHNEDDFSCKYMRMRCESFGNICGFL